MEENKKIQVNNKILYTDTSPEFQPEGTSRFRLNAVPETNLGEQGNFSNELGNLPKIQLSNQNIIIGHIPILDDKTIIFSVRQDNTNSEIGIYNEKTEVYSTLINADCLSFRITNQVRGEFKVREGCNINIYFTDFINPFRAIDIDNLNQYKDNLGNWDCNLFKLFRDYNQTNVDMQVFNTGGNTKVGMYQFTYQYLDDDFNPQPWNTPSNPIPIVKDSLNDYITLDGDETNTDTNKSIQITISNIDTRYKFVRIGLITSILGTGFNSNAYVLEEVPVENNSITYLFSGLDPNKTQSTDLEAFQYLPPDYYTGKDLTQIDNSLVIAYPKARDVDYVPFIQAALQIKSRYYIKDIFAEATGENSFGNRYPNNYFYNKSLMRDEVYSFGVVFIFNDGTETPAFHIPGRAKDRFSFDNTIINPTFYENEVFPSFNLHNRAKTTEYGGNGSAWDSVEYNATLDEIKSNVVDERQISNNKVERWKLFNTAIRLDYSQQQDNLGYFISKGELAYWESQDYTYPATTDCSGNLIYGDLVGQKVRYHKMPDATLEPHYYGYSNKTNPTAQNFATIRPLNVEFFDINIPAQYADQIQGYRIVRVERNTFNSSVVDKGLMYQNEPYSENGQSNELGVTQNFPFNRRLNALQNTLPTTLDLDENYYRWFAEPNPNNYYAEIVKGTRHKSIHSPTTKVNKGSSVADYIKIERTLFAVQGSDFTIYNRGVRSNNDRVYYDEIADTYYRLGQNDVWHGEIGVRYNNSDIPKSLSDAPWQKNITNRRINKQGYIEAGFNKTGVFDYPFYNKTQNETFAVELGGIENFYGDISTGGDFSTTPYTPIGLGFLKAGPSSKATVDGNVSFGGQPTNLHRELSWNPINDNNTNALFETAFYVSLKRYLPNQYNGISQQVYVVPSDISTNTSYIYSDGDCFINDWAFKKYCEFSDEGNSTGYRFLEEFRDGPGTNFITLRSLNRFWCESPINMELRHSKEDVVNSYYDNIGNDTDELHKTAWYAPKNYNDGNNMIDFLLPEVAWNNGRFGTVRNFYGYNKDFSIENTTRFFFPLPINYDYCNTCRVKFPHRLANSNKAYQEERADNYRVFLPNNYRDIPGNTGSINEIFIKNNKLFIHTLQSLWEQQIKPQQIKTDQATLYVGTGEFWEIPPNEVITTINGYAGCQHQFSTINTPFGYFWVSERERKVFLFNDKLTEISNQGLRNWFENNLEFELLKQYPLLPQTTNGIIDNPSNPVGVGYTVSYDKRYRRIILSKKDYKVLNTNLVLINNQWFLGDVPKDITDKTLFENKSWTISYHPDSQGFISWHSYLPYYMFNTQNSYYSFSSEAFQTGWEHNTGNFQTYYQTKYPYIVEYTVPYQTTNLIDTINFYNKVYQEIDNQWVELPNETYDKVIVYNDNQVTPELDIIVTNPTPFQSVQSIANTDILATKAEEDWHISGFIDYSNTANLPLFTQDWAQIQNNYFIDKVVNPAKLGLTQSVFDLKQFRSKFINYRLSTNNLNNYKFVSKYDITGFRTSDR